MSRYVWHCFVLLLMAQTVVADESEWQPLFDGATLTGWQANENSDSWSVEDGAIVTRGDRSHLFYTGGVANHKFKNFELLVEAQTTPGSNSGIYVHTHFQAEGWPATGYELQIINSNHLHGGYVEQKMTGSIYAIRNTWRAPVDDLRWFKYRIRVSGKTLQTFIDDQLVCEYTEPADPYRPSDKVGRLLGAGTIALQAHDPHSVVRFRSIQVRLLPDDAQSLGDSLRDRELDELITEFSNANQPLIDLGIKPVEESHTPHQLSEARRYGITLSSGERSRDLATDQSIVIVRDRDSAPDPAFLRHAKEIGAKIAFSSGGDTRIDEARLKRRLQAIKAADLGWQDFWIPWQK